MLSNANMWALWIMQALNRWPFSSTRSVPPTNQTLTASGLCSHAPKRSLRGTKDVRILQNEIYKNPALYPASLSASNSVHFISAWPTHVQSCTAVTPLPPNFINLEFWQRSELIHYASHSSLPFWPAPLECPPPTSQGPNRFSLYGRKCDKQTFSRNTEHAGCRQFLLIAEKID